MSKELRRRWENFKIEIGKGIEWTIEALIILIPFIILIYIFDV